VTTWHLVRTGETARSEKCYGHAVAVTFSNEDLINDSS